MAVEIRIWDGVGDRDGDGSGRGERSVGMAMKIERKDMDKVILKN